MFARHDLFAFSCKCRCGRISSYNRALLGDLSRVATRTITAFIRATVGEPDPSLGLVASIQTHGSLPNWQPHLHVLVTDGGFRPDGTLVRWPGGEFDWTACNYAFQMQNRTNDLGARRDGPALWGALTDLSRAPEWDGGTAGVRSGRRGILLYTIEVPKLTVIQLCIDKVSSDLWRSLWEQLTLQQQNLLRAVVASTDGLTTKVTLERFSLGSSGSATNSQLLTSQHRDGIMIS